MGVSGLAGVFCGGDGGGRRRAVPGALQHCSQDPLPAQHQPLLPLQPHRPRVVPQPGKAALRGWTGAPPMGKDSHGFLVCLFLTRPRAVRIRTPSSWSGCCVEWPCLTSAWCPSPSPGLSTKSYWTWPPPWRTWRNCCQPGAGMSQAWPKLWLGPLLWPCTGRSQRLNSEHPWHLHLLLWSF